MKSIKNIFSKHQTWIWLSMFIFSHISGNNNQRRNQVAISLLWKWSGSTVYNQLLLMNLLKKSMCHIFYCHYCNGTMLLLGSDQPLKYNTTKGTNLWLYQSLSKHWIKIRLFVCLEGNYHLKQLKSLCPRGHQAKSLQIFDNILTTGKKKGKYAKQEFYIICRAVSYCTIAALLLEE